MRAVRAAIMAGLKKATAATAQTTMNSIVIAEEGVVEGVSEVVEGVRVVGMEGHRFASLVCWFEAPWRVLKRRKGCFLYLYLKLASNLLLNLRGPATRTTEGKMSERNGEGLSQKEGRDG